MKAAYFTSHKSQLYLLLLKTDNLYASYFNTTVITTNKRNIINDYILYFNQSFSDIVDSMNCDG